MKVLQINSVCGYGSTGRITTDIYKILKEQGHECLIAYGRGNAPKGINSIKIGTNFDNYIHAIKTRLLDRHGFASIKATKEFIKKAKEYDPDVIHLHNIHGYYINIELLFNYLKEANKPVIWTLHDCWAFTGHCTHFDYVNCDKWKILCNECQQISQYPKSIKDNSKNNYMLKKKIFTSLSNLVLVTPSRWLANLVKKSYLSKYNVAVINNGIDLNVFKPLSGNFRIKYNLQDKFIILGVASILGERKGLNYFFELAKKLDSSYQIIIVGIPSKEIRKLPVNVIGIERTNDIDELKEIYTAADVFVNPTLEEVFGMVNLEALACGTPVITFNTGGSVECIDENCGIVVEKGNINGLIKSILKLKEHHFDSNNCIERAKAYDENSKYYDYIRIYEGDTI